MKLFNVPTLLTLIRLIISPVMLPILLVTFLPWNYLWLNILLALLFGALCLTDFFDGFLARRYKQTTPFGKLLDPIADKFLVYSTLVSLLAAGKIYFYWVIVLIGRELFVMGLRTIALEKGIMLPVSFWGKLKTVAQMGALLCIILNPYQHAAWTYCWNITEQSLLFVALFLSVLSAWHYYRSFKNRYPLATATDYENHETSAYESERDDDF